MLSHLLFFFISFILFLLFLQVQITKEKKKKKKIRKKEKLFRAWSGWDACNHADCSVSWTLSPQPSKISKISYRLTTWRKKCDFEFYLSVSVKRGTSPFFATAVSVFVMNLIRLSLVFVINDTVRLVK